MSDHLGRLRTLRIMIATSMVATPALYVFRQDLIAFYVLLFFVYYCYGPSYPSTPRWRETSGDEVSGARTMVCCCWPGGLPGVMGPVLGARVFVSTGAYQYAFFGSAGLACAALIILSIVRNPRPVAVAPASALADPNVTPAILSPVFCL